MKKIVYLLLIVFLAVPSQLIAQNAQAIINFEKLIHDYGSFEEEKGLQSYNFAFTNTGTSPLILNNVQASCGCTTPEWTRKPVAPGGKGFVKVSYNPRNRPGSFNKTINVISNASNPRVVLRVKGDVIPRVKTLTELYPRKIGPVLAKSNHIAFVKIKEGKVVTDSLEIVNNSEKSIELKFRQAPQHLEASVKPSVLKPKEKGHVYVTYDASKVKTYGFVMHRIYLDIDGKSDYRNSIGVSATIEEDFSRLTADELKNAPIVNFSEKSFDFGEIKQGDKVEHTFTIKNTGKRDLIIRNIKAACGCTAVTPEKRIINPNESVPLKVVFNSRGKRGRQNKAITVITNDPKNPTSILRVSTNIQVAG